MTKLEQLVTAEELIEEYVCAIGYENFDTFRMHHNIHTAEHCESVQAVTNYMIEKGLFYE